MVDNSLSLRSKKKSLILKPFSGFNENERIEFFFLYIIEHTSTIRTSFRSRPNLVKSLVNPPLYYVQLSLYNLSIAFLSGSI